MGISATIPKRPVSWFMLLALAYPSEARQSAIMLYNGVAYLVGAVAALNLTIAANRITAGNSLGSGHDQRREGHNWQKESGCTEEHFA